MYLMKKVVVLMSTYNGDDYIEEQIESIYNQTYSEIELYIRDDGSTSSFVRKLQQLQKQYGFTLFLEENVGFLQSFYKLLKQVNGADYYAFSDQDDIWLPDKISDAVKWLDGNDNTIPLLYHGAYEIHNTKGEKTGCFRYSDDGYDFRRSITENHYSGFAMVVNSAMRNAMLQADVNRIQYHDWWAANIALGFGKAHFSEKICAIHRAHEHNVTRITLWKRIVWFKDSLKEESEIHSRMTEYKRLFAEKLSEKDRKWLDRFSDSRYRFGDALIKVFYYKRWRPVLSSEIAMRMLMLIGKI